MRRLRMCKAYRCLHIHKRNVWRLEDSNEIYEDRADAAGRVLGVKAGLILFGHGARDPQWVQPFERLAARVRAQTTAEVRLAFLEFMAPDLLAAAEALIAGGVASIHIVPVFFGQGGHVQRDLPARVEALRQRHPGVDFHCAAAVGEDAAVIEALAGYCLRALEE